MTIPYPDDPLQEKQRRLKTYLVTIGAEALSSGDMATVHWITTLISGGSLRHV